MIPVGIKILRHEDDRGSATDFLKTLTESVRQERRTHNEEEEHDERQSGNKETSRSMMKKRGRRRSRSGRQKARGLDPPSSSRRQAILRHHDPRDEDLAPQRISSTSSSYTNSAAAVANDTIPIEVLCHRFSFTPLERFDMWLWRDLMNDGILRALLRRRAYISGLRTLEVRESIGWTAKTMSLLLRSTTQLTTINMVRVLSSFFFYFSLVLLFSLFSLSLSLSLCLSLFLSFSLCILTLVTQTHPVHYFHAQSLSPFVLSFSLLVIFSPLVLLAQTRSWHPLAACAKSYAH